MNQPTAPCSPPSTNSSRSQGRSRPSIGPVAQNQISGPRNTHADQPAPQAVGPFSQKMWRETLQAEPLVQQRILRNLLVEQGIVSPSRRGSGAGGTPAQRRPFHDGLALNRREPGDAAQDDHDQDHPVDDEQPAGHEPAVALTGGTVSGEGAGKIPHIEWHCISIGGGSRR